MTNAYVDFLIDILNTSINGILIIFVAILICLLKNRISAQMKQKVLFITFSGLFFLLLLTVLSQDIRLSLPSYSVIDLNEYKQREATYQSDRILAKMTEKLTEQDYSYKQANHQSVMISDFFYDWKWYVSVLWLSGFLWVAFRLSIGIIGALRIKKHAVPSEKNIYKEYSVIKKELNINRNVALLTHGANFTPLTFGFIKPVIIFPEESISWSNERIKIALYHELIHIKSGDFMKNIFVMLVCAIFWFNPIVWVAAKKYRFEQEAACDELVICSGIKPHIYAKELLDLTRACNSLKIVSAFADSNTSMTEKRIKGILSGDKTKRTKKPWYLLFGLLFTLAIVIPTALFNFVKAEEQYISSDVPSLWPLQEGHFDIVSYFGEKMSQGESDGLVLNRGVNLRWTGEQINIHASADGIVNEVKKDKNGYVNISIQHKNNLVTYYGYLCSGFVEEGYLINRGDVIGESTIQGIIHFEIRNGEKVIDPLLLLEDPPFLASGL